MTKLSSVTSAAKISAIATCLTILIAVKAFGADTFVEFAPYRNRINAQTLSHGQLQVNRMVQDRPQMKHFVDSKSTLRNWCVKQFAGEFTGRPLNWQPVRLVFLQDCFSYCTPCTSIKPGSITICKSYKDKEVDGEKLWAAAVFELFYIRNSERLAKLSKEVRLHKISKNQALEELTKMEHKARLQLRDFYTKNLKEEFGRKGIKSSADKWAVNTPPSYEKWFSKFPNNYYQGPLMRAEREYLLLN